MEQKKSPQDCAKNGAVWARWVLEGHWGLASLDCGIRCLAAAGDQHLCDFPLVLFLLGW